MTDDVKTVNAILESANINTQRGSTLGIQLTFSCEEGRNIYWGGRMFYYLDYKKSDDLIAYTVKRPCYLGYFISRLMGTLLDQISGDDNWEDLPGTHCRLQLWETLRPTPTPFKAIGHFMKDKWFYPDKEMDEIDRIDSLIKNSSISS